jgi:hypothetical protein
VRCSKKVRRARLRPATTKHNLLPEKRKIKLAKLAALSMIKLRIFLQHQQFILSDMMARTSRPGGRREA